MPMMIDEAFGLKPDPTDSRDLQLHTVIKTASNPLPLTGDVDLSGYCTESRQLWAGSCVGNACADAVEIINAIEGKPRVELSRLFVYALARHLMDDDGDSRNDLNLDQGTFIRLGMDVLSRFGICTEAMWPYDLKKLFRSPSIKAMREAAGHRIHEYYRIGSTGDSRLEEIVWALRQRQVVVFGTQVNHDFTRLGNEGPVGPPTGSTKGGHAMIIVGYEAAKGFLIKNSWGKTWGDDGFAFLTEDYIKWESTRDIWVPMRGVAF